MAYPSWSIAWWEAVVLNLGLNFTLNYLGRNLRSEVMRATQAKYDVMGWDGMGQGRGFGVGWHSAVQTRDGRVWLLPVTPNLSIAASNGVNKSMCPSQTFGGLVLLLHRYSIFAIDGTCLCKQYPFSRNIR